MSINKTFVRHKSAGGSLPKKHRDCIWSTTCSLSLHELYSHCMKLPRGQTFKLAIATIAGNATVAETIAVSRSVLIIAGSSGDRLILHYMRFIADKSAL